MSIGETPQQPAAYSNKETLLTSTTLVYETGAVLEITGDGVVFNFSDVKEALPLPGNEVIVETDLKDHLSENPSGGAKRHQIGDCLYVFTDNRGRTIVYSDMETKRAETAGMDNPVRAVQIVGGGQGVHVPSIVIGQGWEVANLPASAPVNRILIKLHDTPKELDDKSVRIYRESPFDGFERKIQKLGVAEHIAKLPII